MEVSRVLIRIPDAHRVDGLRLSVLTADQPCERVSDLPTTNFHFTPHSTIPRFRAYNHSNADHFTSIKFFLRTGRSLVSTIGERPLTVACDELSDQSTLDVLRIDGRY
jgi:hypothetical protein